MRNECNIISDLLPLYIENIASEESVSYVDKHLAGCAECQKELEALRAATVLPANIDAAPLKALQQKMNRKRIQVILFSALLAAIIVISCVAYLTSPQYFPYSEYLFSVTTHEDGTLITFDEEVSRYSLYSYFSEDEGITILELTAWTTNWDKLFSESHLQSVVVGNATGNADGLDRALYYLPNNGEEDVFIYGPESYRYSDSITLPRLALAYYLILALFAAAILCCLSFIVRKNSPLQAWVRGKALPLPVSYLIAHLCIKGWSTMTYSMQRDFSLIVLVTILLYLGFQLGINLYQTKRMPAA